MKQDKISPVPVDNPQEIKDQEEIEKVITVSHQETYSGPLPPPAMLKAYKEIDPSYPEQILQMAVNSVQMAINSNNAAIKAMADEAEL